MTQRNIIAIGASSGGVAALRTLLSELGPSLSAAILVVQHIGPHESMLPRLLHRSGGLPAQHAVHGEPLVAGRVYVAPPDHHLLVTRESILLTRGPKENHTRPAIDPLFRSVAVHHGAAAIGVVLTGHLDDGTSGLMAIKTCGGMAVVQDPQDAEAPSMPESALHHVEVDHVVPVARMGALLTRLVTGPAAALAEAPTKALADELRLGASEGRAEQRARRTRASTLRRTALP
ncbi:chemotaxis protein CheB [Schlegelella sp. S2-27]|uniref:protein-glutamate methylesterase n=1 Tax=Caldimonas mangrovi TaxID=2944811 RepID=A0ABT0YU58_9BURK|nr:chemotaxis protein CheB [Caldimonas mangrovi]MCM5682285.1 chemotaxis protein CheB [Caldimonas mangrovi]